MRYYDHQFGIISDMNVGMGPRARGLTGCHGLGCLGNLGTDDCAAILAEVKRLQGLAKTRSKKEHRKAAAAAAAAAMQRYQQCVAAKTAPVATPPAPIVPTPITPPIATTPEPIPYVPYSGGGGGGGGGAPEMVPMPDGGDYGVTPQVMSYCTDAQGNAVPCESLQRAQPVAQPVTPQVQPSIPLTQVPYVQMPADGAARGGEAELVPYGEGMQMTMMPTAAEQTGIVPASYAPQYYGQQAAAVNEKDLLAKGPTEYTDQWGTIEVLELVFPAAQAKAAAQAAATITPSGTGVQPGGEMKVEDFTSAYVTE